MAVVEAPEGVGAEGHAGRQQRHHEGRLGLAKPDLGGERGKRGACFGGWAPGEKRWLRPNPSGKIRGTAATWCGLLRGSFRNQQRFGRSRVEMDKRFEGPHATAPNLGGWNATALTSIARASSMLSLMWPSPYSPITARVR